MENKKSRNNHNAIQELQIAAPVSSDVGILGTLATGSAAATQTPLSTTSIGGFCWHQAPV
jgi:hypothetical protein